MMSNRSEVIWYLVCHSSSMQFVCDDFHSAPFVLDLCLSFFHWFRSFVHDVVAEMASVTFNSFDRMKSIWSFTFSVFRHQNERSCPFICAKLDSSEIDWIWPLGKAHFIISISNKFDQNSFDSIVCVSVHFRREKFSSQWLDYCTNRHHRRCIFVCIVIHRRLIPGFHSMQLKRCTHIGCQITRNYRWQNHSNITPSIRSAAHIVQIGMAHSIS